MSQIQNNCLQYAAQPLAFFAAAFLAGRLVQHFPGATPKGLLLSAAIGSTTTLAAQRIFASKDESAWYSLARNVACLALAVFLTPYAARSLKGRADITLPAAFRFCAVEGIIAAGLVFVSSRQTTVNALYDKYANDLDAWAKLSKEERTNLIKRLYENDFPPLSLQNLTINDPFPTITPDAYAQMTENQLEWHVEMSVYCINYPQEHLFYINLALHQKNLPMEWLHQTSQDTITYAQTKPECEELLYTHFIAHPIEFFMLQEGPEDGPEDVIDFKNLFDKKAPIPSMIEYLETLEEEGFQQLSDNELRCIHSYYHPNDLKEVPAKQLFLIKSTLSTRLNELIWLWPITQEIVTIAQADPNALNLLYHDLSTSPLAFAAIEEGLRNQLSALFTEKELVPIESATKILDGYSAEDIYNLSLDELWDCHVYFKKNLDAWNSQIAEKATAFIKCFIDNATYNDFKPLPIDSIAIEFGQINSCQTVQDAASLEKNAVRWLLALEQKQSFLDTKVKQTLNLRLQEIEKEDP